MRMWKGKERKQWIWRLMVPVFFAAFFSVASASGGWSAKTFSQELIGLARARLDDLSVKMYLPILSYQADSNGKSVWQQVSVYVESFFPMIAYVQKESTAYDSRQAAYQAYARTKAEDPVTAGLLEKENQKQKETIEMPAKEKNLQKEAEALEKAAPVTGKAREYSIQKLRDFDYLLQNFYRVDSTTTTNSSQLNVDKLLKPDMTVDLTKKGPQILIYHTHSQERFADSKDESQSVVGLGDILTGLLEKQGYSVLHDKGTYDIPDRDTAYSRSAPALESILKQYPQIQVIIDLHRDGVADGIRLVQKIQGKDMATIMLFNGLSHSTDQGDIAYLYNPNLDDNLAFSFQTQLAAAEYYPGFSRGIYLRGYRYNLHYRPKSLLVEVGAQTNTWQEVVNAMKPLADILNKVMSGETRKNIKGIE